LCFVVDIAEPSASTALPPTSAQASIHELSPLYSVQNQLGYEIDGQFSSPPLYVFPRGAGFKHENFQLDTRVARSTSPRHAPPSHLRFFFPPNRGARSQRRIRPPFQMFSPLSVVFDGPLPPLYVADFSQPVPPHVISLFSSGSQNSSLSPPSPGPPIALSPCRGPVFFGRFRQLVYRLRNSLIPCATPLFVR